MKNLRYISVQPAIQYYTWQVEVMINNFLKNNINPNNVDIICSIRDGNIPEDWTKLANKFNTVRFFFYNDTRENVAYISSIRPHILKKHFEAHPYLKDEVIFYHDCDMVFTKPVDWSKFLHDDVWYLSDTNSYVNSTYVKSKGCGIYEHMCELIGISEDIPEKYVNDGGGAQYIMKNIDATFWEKVEKDSEALYRYFCEHLITHPESPTYHPIQKWTADMWAVLWNAWFFGHDTKVVKEMDFCWPMNPLTQWESNDIFHNAGVVHESSTRDKLFYKGLYINTLPYDIKQEDYKEGVCGSKYVEEIIETANGSCLR